MYSGTFILEHTFSRGEKSAPVIVSNVIAIKSNFSGEKL